MLYSRKDLLAGLERLQQKFGAWKSDQLALVCLNENHLIEGKNFLGWLRTNDPVENVLLDVLEQFSLKSETMGVGSAVDVVHNVLTGKKSLNYSDISNVMNCSRYPRSNDLEKMILERFDEKYHELLFEILNCSETDGSIFLKREHVVKTVLEKLDGYVFSLSSPMRVQFDERNVRCFVIDGFVESVGEIHRILEQMSKTREPGIIFARNFADDVVSTLQHNKLTGRMNVLPIRVTFDMEDLNTLVDIAMISAGDVVSSDKGDLIRSLTADSVPVLERVIYKNEKLVIVNSKTVDRVKLHLENLRKKAHEVDEVRRKLYEGRMGSLSTNCLKISIPVGKQFDALESNVDLFLRLVRTCLMHGVVEVEGKIQPVTTYLSSNAFTKKFLRTFDENVGAAILD